MENSLRDGNTRSPYLSPEKPVIVAETSTRETKHHIQRVGELGFITPAGPEELTLQALSPEQRAYRVFIDRL